MTSIWQKKKSGREDTPSHIHTHSIKNNIDAVYITVFSLFHITTISEYYIF